MTEDVSKIRCSSLKSAASRAELDANVFGDEGTMQLARVIEHQGVSQSQGTSTDSGGTEDVGNADKGLQCLLLRKNTNISDEGAKALANAIQVTPAPPLLELNLSGTSIGVSLLYVFTTLYSSRSTSLIFILK